MAEGGFEMDEFGRTEDVADTIDDDATTPFIDIDPNESASILTQEDALAHFTGDSLTSACRELLKTKVNAFLKAIAAECGLLPAPHIYDEFVLERDGRSLYLKEGGKRVTWKKDSTKYVALKSLGSADFIRTRLFPDYTTTRNPTPPPRTKKVLAKIKQTAEQATVESTELADLPQRAADVDTEVKRLFADDTGALPVRELLGLDKALQRQRGILADNLAKLRQLDANIAAAEDELGGEEAANDPEKKHRIEDLLQRLRDEHSTRLEAAAANRDALRTQFSRIGETIERILNDDTTLAESLRTLFREQGVTIASILTAFGFIVSTIVLAIQNTLGGGAVPQPAPPHSGAADWVKKQLRMLSDWLKMVAEKAAAALPGVIGAIVSWLLKTAGMVTVWLAEHLWALAAALVAVAAIAVRRHMGKEPRQRQR